MGIPSKFNDIIKDQLNVFAAWLPITNAFQLGDYGIISDGVFAKMGNISEFNVTIKEGMGKEASIDFTSASTTVVNFNAGVEVAVIPDGAVDAKVAFKFEKAQSFIVKSPAINVITIDNINEVGKQLIDSGKWERRFKVVYQLYSAKEAVIMSTIDAGTTVTFDGNVQALQQLKLGSVDVGFSSTKKLGLTIQAKEGAIGLGLFRITKGFLGLGEEHVAVLELAEEPIEKAIILDQNDMGGDDI